MKKFILEVTGQEVDGIDEGFEAFSKVIGYGKPCRLGRIQLNPGMPLYHINSLLEASKNAYGSSNPTLQTTIAWYVLAWVRQQSDKLTQILERVEANHIVSTTKLSVFNKCFQNSELSEFHLLLSHCSSRDVQYLFTSNVLLGFGGLLSTESKFLPSEAGILFSHFEMLLRKLFLVDPLLSNIKNKPTHVRDLKYIKYCILHFEMMKSFENRDFLRAEIFANKASENFKKLGQSREFKSLGITLLQYMVIKSKVSIAEKSNDMVLMSYAIEALITMAEETAKDEEIAKSGVLDPTHISQGFILAEVCFKMAEDYEKAHRCAQEALKWTHLERSKNMEYSQQYHDSLTRLMSVYAQNPVFDKIIRKVTCYPNSHVFLLEFTSEDPATYFRALLDKNDQAHQRVANSITPEQKSTVALTFNHEFNIEVFKLALKMVLDKILNDEKRAAKELERAAKIEKLNQSQQAQQAQDPGQSNNEMTSYIHRPSAIHKIQRAKKAKKPESMLISVPRFQFFEEIRRKPLTVVEFSASKRIFDPNPDARTGVVTLCVDHVPGRWFAIFNPRLIDMLENRREAEKILRRFSEEKVLGNDFCVPCKKEMAMKSLPYVFKIRLLGGNGKGDIRIYAHVIETLPDGKSLVAFSSINDKSHSKHTIPKLIDFPEEVGKELTIVPHKK